MPFLINLKAVKMINLLKCKHITARQGVGQENDIFSLRRRTNGQAARYGLR